MVRGKIKAKSISEFSTNIETEIEGAGLSVEIGRASERAIKGDHDKGGRRAIFGERREIMEVGVGRRRGM